MIIDFILDHVIKFFSLVFDTCDVVYNCSISLVTPIVLNNLFGIKYNSVTLCAKIVARFTMVSLKALYVEHLLDIHVCNFET